MKHTLRSYLNLAFEICYRSFFCQLRLFLSFVPGGTGRKKAEKWRKKGHNKIEVLNSNSFLGLHFTRPYTNLTKKKVNVMHLSIEK